MINVLKLTVRVCSKIGGYAGTYAYHLQFGDVAFYDFLEKAGIHPAKSKTIGPIAIPDNFYPDLLRGNFDGDGSVFGGMDARWKNSLMFYTSYVSPSHDFVRWLQRSNSRLIKTTAGSILRTRDLWQLRYAKADSRLIFAAMYH